MARRRTTVARHAHLRSPSIVRQILTIVAVAVVVVLTASIGTAVYAAQSLRNTFAENAVTLDDQVVEPPAIGAYDKPFDILVVGTDECEPELVHLFPGRCDGPDAEGRLNDVNMLVHVSIDPRRVTVVSFPRDLQIPIPSCVDEDGGTTPAMSKQPINSAYGTGGLNCVVNTVSELSGLDIPFAAKASFGNVIEITDAIGGVEVCIGEGGLRDRHTGIDWPAGPRTVEGMEALQFLRVRSGIGDGSDLARIGNQQQYLSSLTRKLMDDGVLGNPGALLRLGTAAVENITPSQSLTDPLRIVQLALATREVPLSDITFVQFPVQDDPANPNKVIPDDEAAAALWDALEQNRPLQLTGQAGANGGVVETDPGEGGQTPEPAPVDIASPGATTPPTDEAVELPSNIPGSNAEQRTCSA